MAYGAPGHFVAGGHASGPPVPMQLPKNVVRVGEQALWSSQAYADATALANTEDRVFVTPRGQQGQGFGAALSIAETNIKESSRIPGGYAYDVFGVAARVYYQDNWAIVGADARNTVNNSVLAWDFLQTRIEISHVGLIGEGGGLFGATADTGAAEGGSGGSRTMINNGNGQLWVYRQHPVMLPSDSTFNLVIQWGSSASVVDGGTNNSTMIYKISLLGRFQTAIAVA